MERSYRQSLAVNDSSNERIDAWHFKKAVTERQINYLEALINKSDDFDSISEAAVHVFGTEELNKGRATLLIKVLQIRNYYSDDEARKKRVEAYLAHHE